MLTKESYNNNYTKLCTSYQLTLPINLETLIPEDDSVRLLSHILEGLDYTKLNEAYSSNGRKSAVEPQVMFKILTYAYSQNIYSSRDIEKSCKRDINFKWLLAGQNAPDHTTISRFRQKYLSDNIIEDLFYQQVMYLFNQEEILFENLFIDGTKIEANANKYSFIWRKAIIKNEEKMFIKIKDLVEDINLKELANFEITKDNLLSNIEDVLKHLECLKATRNIEYVKGIGKRKSQIQKWNEKLLEYKKRQENYNQIKALMDNRNSYSKTDIDATFMHMKDDHMRNSQLKPAYNVQIGVESEYITGVGIFPDRNDVTTLISMIENMETYLKHGYKNIIADSGYESEENYVFLENTKKEAYIKPQTYEKWKKKSFKNDISKRENMKYDDENDIYICHNNKQLKVVNTATRSSSSGYKAEVTIYECEDCTDCTFKPKCTKAKGNKKLHVSKNFIKKREESHSNITTTEGTLLRMNRSIQVEGAFGVLKNNYQFNRFLTRGKTGVKTEFMLLCFGYNINKYHAKIQNSRCRNHLHKLKESA